MVSGQHKPGISTTPGRIHFNANSGAQAINLAVLWGARRLVLVGFDMGPLSGKAHFFGDHPKPLRNESPYATFRRNFDTIARDLKRLGVETVNTSMQSHLQCFEKVPLREALRDA